jgi:hypothetical protein
MFNFFEKIGKFVVNLMVILLILLISVQIVLRNDTTRTKIETMEKVIISVFNNIEKNITPSQSIVQVFESKNEYVGTITIDLLQNQSLPQVYLQKNGQNVANFSDGIVKVKVKEGDFLTINSKYYSKVLWFEITELTSIISSFEKGQQFRTSGSDLNLGIVRVNDKL